MKRPDMRVLAILSAALLVAFVALAVRQMPPNVSLMATSYRVSAACGGGVYALGVSTGLHLPLSRGCQAIALLGQATLPRAAVPSSNASLAAPAYPLAVSSNGRYLVDRNGTPFMINGDSPQALAVAVSESDMELYLANRARYGINTVWVNLVCNYPVGCRPDAATYDGIAPFVPSGDLSHPNEAYFQRIDSLLQVAERYGLLVLLDPMESSGWLDVLRANGVDKAYAYGYYVGSRYRDVPNILWLNGNDFQTWHDASDDALVMAVARGIRDGDPNHLQTVELNYYRSSSRDDDRWSSLIQVDAAYTYSPTYAQILDSYNRSPAMPVFMVEASYEFENSYTGPATLRRQAYWSLLSGATGHLYGNAYIWPMSSGWKSYLDSIGARDMSYLANLFASVRWYDFIPDQNHSVVTAGYGTYAESGNVNDNDYVTAARSAEGTLLIAYIPTERTIAVDLESLQGMLRARWYDPSTGSFTRAADSLLPSEGTREFHTPGNNGDGDSDWVLVIDST